MKITILDKNSLGKDLPLDTLLQFGEVNSYDTTSQGEALDHISDSDIIIINKVKITEDILNRAPKLRLICIFATGFDNVDVIAARERGIAVCNVPGYSTESVVLYTIATVLSLVSKITKYNEYVRSGEYTESGIPNRLVPVFHELKGKTWGIIGAGNIGSRVRDVAEALGCRVLVYKRKRDDRFNCVDLKTLAEESDIITVHCPLNDESRNMIDRELISTMKHEVIIVNEARGAVVCEEAIVNAVKDGRIAGYGSDVYTTEPLPVSSPLYSIKDKENVLLTPHCAWGAFESRLRCLQIICNNIASFLNNERLNRVDPI